MGGQKALERGLESTAERNMETGREIFVKAIPLRSYEDVVLIKSEVRSGNIVISNVTPLAKQSMEDVKRAVNELNDYVSFIGGDIARLGEERIVLTPRNVKIWRG